MNGKIGSGEASAVPENEIMIAAPKTAMRLGLNACTLNMGRPLIAFALISARG
jgi:hypothetical protein